MCSYPDPDRSSVYPQIPIPQYLFNIILPNTRGSSKWSLSLRFHHQNLVYTSQHPIHATCSTNLILLDLITRIILGEEYRSLISSLCSFPHSPVTSSLLGPNILLNTLFLNTLSIRSFLNESYEVSHSYKTGWALKGLSLVCCVVNWVSYLQEKLWNYFHSWVLPLKLLYDNIQLSQHVHTSPELTCCLSDVKEHFPSLLDSF